jgi:hypothetical protein
VELFTFVEGRFVRTGFRHFSHFGALTLSGRQPASLRGVTYCPTSTCCAVPTHVDSVQLQKFQNTHCKVVGIDT